MFDEIFRQVLRELHSKSRIYDYHQLEYNCHTNLTDEDMIKMHIDFALENGDRETFMELSEQLKEMVK